MKAAAAGVGAAATGSDDTASGRKSYGDQLDELLSGNSATPLAAETANAAALREVIAAGRKASTDAGATATTAKARRSSSRSTSISSLSSDEPTAEAVGGRDITGQGVRAATAAR